MKKYFLDCGTNLAQGLIKFIDDGIIDSTFEIHCFEPNPYAIEFSKNRLLNSKYKNYSIIFNEVALWTEECSKVLTLESFDGEYFCQQTGNLLGYDLKSGGATNIMGDEWSKPGWIEDNWIDKSLEVKCIDFSEYLKKTVNENDYVICKMDIEGAEYDVLGKLIDDDSIDLIDEIYIEWHNHLLKTNYDTQAFIDEMKRRNIKVESWI
jgi:FkbM family methyltransferase